MFKALSWSVPWVRDVATSRAKPIAASQAEKARRSIGAEEKIGESNWRVHNERAKYRDSIIPSRHSKAESRWVRWNDSPDKARIKHVDKVKCMGVMRVIEEFNLILLSRNQMFLLD